MDVPGYRVGRELGRGGSAVAVEAVDAHGRRAVIKLFHLAGDPRAGREAAAMARLGAPLAPLLLQAGQLADGRPFLAMEAIDGEPLATGAARSPPAVVDWLGAASASVDAMHAAGVVHRDLKPPHLWRRRDGKVTMIDFALARLDGDRGDGAIAAQLTRHGERLGTAAYMAPEQCRGEPDIGPAADVYALGVVAFELLTGRRPFTGSAAEIRAAHASARPPAASAFAPLSAAIDAALARCLAKDPASRPPSAAAFAGELDDALRAAPAAVRAAAAEPARWQEVAVLAFATTGAAPEVDAALGLSLAHLDGPCCVVAFPGTASLATGVESACRAARELAARVAVAGPVLVAVAGARPGRGGRTRLRDAGAVLAELAGAPLDADLVLGATAAAALDPVRVRPLGGGYAGLTGAIDPSPADPALVDREPLIAALVADAAAGPGVATIFGEAGLGKTRLLAELAGRLDPVWWLRPDPEHGALAALVGAAELELGAGFDQLVPPAAAAALAAALGRSAPLIGTPAETRKRAAAAAVDLVRRAARDRPLAVLVDDAHLADTVALDALEALGENVAWVCVTARAGLRDARPGWAAGARASEHQLAPLSPAGSAALLRELLAAEFVPDAVVDRLRDAAAGVPLFLVELARALRTSALRVGSDAPGLYLAADQLVHLSTVPVAERNARAELEAMSEPLRQLCVLCAVVGDEVRPAEVDALQRQLGGDWLDAGVGIQRLVAAGILIPVGPAFRFRHPVARAALEAAARPGEAARFHLAQLALVEGDLARTAVHAAAAGERARAGRAHLELAERARCRHAYVDAELAYSAALAQLDSEEERRTALAGRASVRYQIHRLDDALADATSAREQAEALGQLRQTVELLLLESMILDWRFDVEASAERAERARALATGMDDLEPALLAAEGRTAYRREQYERAAELFERAVASGDYQTRMAALPLHAISLLYLGRDEEAEVRYAEVIALCEEVGDDLHLAAALGTRPVLWSRRGRMDLAGEDLRRVLAIARRLGNALIERTATHNLAEVLYWQGELEAALPLAIRSRDLQRRFTGEGELPDDALLVARIQTARGQLDLARAELATLTSRDGLAPTARMLLRMLELVLHPSTPADWDALESAVRALEAPELLGEFERWRAVVVSGATRP
jgi:tetratricopeptide (TPR) repeat protein